MGSELLGSGTSRASVGLKPTDCFSFVLKLICYLQIYLLPLSVAVSSSPWGKRVSTSLLPAMVPAKEKTVVSMVAGDWWPTGHPLATLMMVIDEWWMVALWPRASLSVIRF